MNRKMDLALASLITLIMPGIHYLIGIYFFENLYYPKYNFLHFIIFPTVAILISSVGKPAPLFTTGIALAFFITYLLFITLDIIWPRDMVGLDHWLATPGAIIGTIIALVLLKRQSNLTQRKALTMGLAGALIGFLVTNEVFCNTVTYCGPLSALFYTKHM